MLTVILGAGASYDAVPAIPIGQSDTRRLPLADELFDLRGDQALRFFPACAPLVPLLRSRPRNVSVEERLDELQQESESDSRRQAQLLAVRFYLQYMIFERTQEWSGASVGHTNYVTLLDEIRNLSSVGGPVAIVTFNYDTMIESAFTATTGRTFGELDDYVAGDTRLFKVHGSTNWARQVPLEQEPAGTVWAEVAYLIEQAHTLPAPTTYTVIGNDHPFGGSRMSRTIPAIAIPFRRKLDFACPEAQLTLLDRILPSTTRLLVIGWGARDTHFLPKLATIPATAKGLIVAGNREDSEGVAQRLVAAGVTAPCDIFPDGFTAFVRERAIRPFLA